MSDLAALFAQDPLTYTKEGGELTRIIAEFRAARKGFLAGNIKAGKTKAPTKAEARAEEIASKLGGLDLSL